MSKRKPTRKPTRKQPSTETTEAVLTKCRRRCALCYFLDGSDSVDLHGQLAHITEDRSDSSEDNLVYLCLKHHDIYDSRTSQSKGLTQGEVRQAKRNLEDYAGFLGRHGKVQSTISLHSDSTPFNESDCGKLIQQLKDISGVTGLVSVSGTTNGGTALQVEMNADDVARLLRSYHRGDLVEAGVKSIQISALHRDREVGYCDRMGPSTPNTPNHIAVRWFLQSDYFQDLSLTNYPGTLRVGAKQHPSIEHLVILTIGFATLSKVNLTEPMFLDRRVIPTDDLRQPFELLKKLLEHSGLPLQVSAHKSAIILLDQKFAVPVGRSSEMYVQSLFRSFVGHRSDRYGVWSLHLRTSNSAYLALVFALSEVERRKQTSLASYAIRN